MADRDYYDILGVPRDAGDDQIKRAYRKLAKQYHPDQNKGNKSAEAKFKEVQEAYDILSDKDKRARFDQFGKAGVDPHFSPHAGGGPFGYSSGGYSGGSPFSGGQSVEFNVEDLSDFFGGGGGSRGGGPSIFEQFFRNRGGPPPEAEEPRHTASRDTEHTIQLTFDQAIHGTTLDLEISVARGKRERVNVKVPAGIRDGQRIRLAGKGAHASGRKPAGDLYIVCRVGEHPYFRRENDDIYLDVPVTFGEAGLGAKIDLPTLDGIRTVTIPPGTTTGARLRLAGLGVTRKDGSRGDHYAILKIVAPPKLTDEQRQLLERFAQATPQTPRNGLWQ